MTTEPANLSPRRPRATPHRAQKAVALPPPTNVRRSTLGVALTFLPFGEETPVVLECVPTAVDAQRLAEAYNRLDWQEHDVLGSDRLIALGRKGAFILEPVMR